MNLPYMLWLDSNYSLNFCTLKEIFILLSQKKAQKDCEIRRKLVVANSVYQNALRKKGLESQSNVWGVRVPYAPQDIKTKSLVNKIFTRLFAFPESAGKCSSEHGMDNVARERFERKTGVSCIAIECKTSLATQKRRQRIKSERATGTIALSAYHELFIFRTRSVRSRFVS